MSTNNSAIIDALHASEAGLTATAIAIELGFSKATRIKADLDALVSSGMIIADDSGRYVMYKLAPKKATVQKSEAAVEKKEEKVTLVGGEKINDVIPVASDSKVNGFSISSIKSDGKAMKRIVTPEGKKIRLENDEKLLVINSKPEFVVKTAEDVISCIRKYAVDNGLNVFTVNDIQQNAKINNDKDVMVKDNHIMFLSIQKHNKAAGYTETLEAVRQLSSFLIG